MPPKNPAEIIRQPEGDDRTQRIGHLLDLADKVAQPVQGLRRKFIEADGISISRSHEDSDVIFFTFVTRGGESLQIAIKERAAIDVAPEFRALMTHDMRLRKLRHGAPRKADQIAQAAPITKPSGRLL